MNPLHWSLDYPDRHPNFSRRLFEALEEYAGSSRGLFPAEARTHRLRYVTLPNFLINSGYEQDKESAIRERSIGYAEITRTRKTGGGIRYEVHHENTTSGEEVRLAYDCDAGPLRALTGGWTIQASHHGDGDCSGIALAGRILPGQSQTEIQIRHESGVAWIAGKVPCQKKVTCNWTLFDLIPDVKGGVEDFALLDGLEVLRPANRIVPIKGFTLGLEGRKLVVSGYVVYGSGHPPSYWWVDEEKRVVAMSTIFSTLVLQRAEAMP